MWDDSKLMGVSGTWTAKIKRFIQEAKRMRRKLSAGIDERLSLISKLRTPITAVQKEYSLCHAGLMNLHFRHLRTEKLPKMNFRADLSDLSILIQSLTRVYKEIVFLMMGTLKITAIQLVFIKKKEGTLKMNKATKLTLAELYDVRSR